MKLLPEEARKALMDFYNFLVEKYRINTKSEPGLHINDIGINIQRLEKEHREGYLMHPVIPGEFSDWEDEQVWPD